MHIAVAALAAAFLMQATATAGGTPGADRARAATCLALPSSDDLIHLGCDWSRDAGPVADVMYPAERVIQGKASAGRVFAPSMR